MKKTSFILLLVSVMALQGGETFARAMENEQETIRRQMAAMLLSMSELDIATHEEEKIDFANYEKRANEILESTALIRRYDTKGVFTKDINLLEERTQKLLNLAKKEDRKASSQVEVVLDTCFTCHKTHQGGPK